MDQATHLSNNTTTKPSRRGGARGRSGRSGRRGKRVCPCVCGCGAPGKVRLPLRAPMLLKASLKILGWTSGRITEYVGRLPTLQHVALARRQLLAIGHYDPAFLAEHPKWSQKHRVPTRRWTNGVYISMAGAAVSATPVTPKFTPMTRGLQEILSSGAPTAEQLVEMGERWTKHLEQLAQLERHATALQNKVVALEARRMWTTSPKLGVASPGLRWDAVKDAPSNIIELLTGWPSAATFERFHGVVNADGRLDKTPLYEAGVLRRAAARAVPASVDVPDATGPTNGATAQPQEQGHDASRMCAPSTTRTLDFSDPASVALKLRTLSSIDMLFLTYFILRTDASHALTAYLFGISISTVSSVFVTTISVLDAVLTALFPPLTYAAALHHTPSHLSTLFAARIPTFVLDATEVRVPSSADPAVLRASFSYYKNSPTAKFSILAHAGGFICAVSEAYAGGTDDDQLADHASVLSLLPTGSRLLVDKGYVTFIDAAREAGIQIVQPGFRRRLEAQLPAQWVEAGAKIARPRVVVERLIGRVKNMFPWVQHTKSAGMLDVLSSAFRVACMTTNFLPALTDCTAQPSQAEVEALAATGIDVNELSSPDASDDELSHAQEDSPSNAAPPEPQQTTSTVFPPLLPGADTGIAIADARPDGASSHHGERCAQNLPSLALINVGPEGSATATGPRKRARRAVDSATHDPW